jgi:pimeloyl-ACP methyl ester carboxylesterase
MTLRDLQSKRKRIPWIISLTCILPWFCIRPTDLEQAGLLGVLALVGPAVVTAFLYVIANIREPRWRREMDGRLGTQIKNALIALAPADLQITDVERSELLNSEIYKKLTGIFWEAVDQSELLVAQKEHFYSNGFLYSTALDAFLLLRFYGVCYAIASIFLGDPRIFLVSLCLMCLAFVIRWIGMSRARQQHLELSREQLELLVRDKGDFVASRFRDIVQGWRASQANPATARLPPAKQKNRGFAISDAVALMTILAIGIWGFADERWATKSSESGPVQSFRSSYISRGQHKKPVVVVFVHGIFGSNQDTWLNSEARITFPHLLATDPTLSNEVDVFAFEYFTPRFGAAPSIVDLADQLRGDLDDNHVFEDHQKVVFLAHSMGGIVVREFLLNQQARLAKVPMIFFYATPTNGSELAALSKLASSNPQLRGMAPIEGNDLLQSIQSMWLGSEQARSISSYCGVEELPTNGVMVVSRSSSTSLCNRGFDPITANHIDIVKPTDRSDPRYSRFANALRETIGGADTN